MLKAIIEEAVREILLGSESKSTEQKPSNMLQNFIGKYVICRTSNEGVNFGKVVNIDETGVVLEEARRLYYHAPKDKSLSWYEGVAQSGLSEKSKVSTEATKLIVEDYSLTLCSEEAIKNIKEFENYEQI